MNQNMNLKNLRIAWEGNIEEEDELDKFMKETKTEALNENRDIIINRIKRINA